ncbi:DUF2271 domain-containing protein [Ottowia sp.]|jgi:hypothetical protein|uniref:DUF2271 domain-containing protein n=1 Tax=Ottowia sp. TaxID=1898956 RepID=UPI0025D35624|nr:DUF2271 domain-containing protein [Ottowia sp.]MBK6613565.1 DUF2271 domain-containing protein [Ottowia sp.]MBK6747330.1 DUF2271 domain-containing protein [Ottowia sp.]
MASAIASTRYSLALGTGLGVVPAVFAAGLNIGVEIPRLDVAEYHRPYVAAWLERADNAVAGTLAVWYEVKKRDNEGVKWLKDMRQWWRRTGRELSVPIDGITGPTRPAGRHDLAFSEGTGPLPKLPAGSYKLVVEASRESGGREVVTVPFDWPAKAPVSLKDQGKSELGAITLDLKP